jgi:hypothetical protein
VSSWSDRHEGEVHDIIGFGIEVLVDDVVADPQQPWLGVGQQHRIQ